MTDKISNITIGDVNYLIEDETKQDIISDLDAIRSGASLGATSIQITSPIASAPYVKEFYQDETGTSGFLVLSNGYCEQWGIHGHSSKTIVVTLLKTYRDTNYNIVASHHNSSSSSYQNGYIQTTGNTFTAYLYNTDYNRSACWKTSGILAEGEY